jgi:tripartite-type tricarboxylate transporter receptor subunit TctC
MSDVPTVAESGLAGYRATVDLGFFAPPARRSRSSTVSRPRRAR